MSIGREDELERFKQDINLIQFSAGYSFVYSRNESTGTYAVLRKDSAKEKLVVTKAANGHWIYFNVHNETDCGTIIDFIQNRRTINLGMIRKDLRSWTGDQHIQIQAKTFPSVKASDFSREAVVASFRGTGPCTSSTYLESRGITKPTLMDPRFNNMVRIDAKGNVIFPHYDKQGLTGYEIKNDGYTGFAKQGRRALWSSQCFMDDDTIVFVESAIDGLSYHVVRGRPRCRYHSVAGAIGGMQQSIIVRVLEKARTYGMKVISAFDNDEEGEKYHALIAELAPEGLNIEREAPPEKDWNQIIDRRKVTTQ